MMFCSGQEPSSPHAGLALFGPYSGGTGSHPRNIVYGVIGAPESGVAEAEVRLRRGTVPPAASYGIPNRLGTRTKGATLWLTRLCRFDQPSAIACCQASQAVRRSRFAVKIRLS